MKFNEDVKLLLKKCLW